MEWKIYIAQIVICILCAIQIIVHGDGEVLKMAIMAEGILGGVSLSQYVAASPSTPKTAESKTEG